MFRYFIIISIIFCSLGCETSLKKLSDRHYNDRDSEFYNFYMNNKLERDAEKYDTVLFILENYRIDIFSKTRNEFVKANWDFIKYYITEHRINDFKNVKILTRPGSNKYLIKEVTDMLDSYGINYKITFLSSKGEHE